MSASFLIVCNDWTAKLWRVWPQILSFSKQLGDKSKEFLLLLWKIKNFIACTDFWPSTIVYLRQILSDYWCQVFVDDKILDFWIQQNIGLSAYSAVFKILDLDFFIFFLQRKIKLCYETDAVK